MSIISGSAAISTTGSPSFYDFPVDQSLMFDGSSILSFTPSSNTNSGLWTYSVWVKLSDFSDGLLLGASPGSWQSDMRFSAGELQFFDDGGNNFNVESSMLFRDTSAFYHIVVVVDSSLSTDKIKIYVNGSVISFSANSQSFTTSKYNHSSYEMRIGGRTTSVVTLKGYLAEVNFIDGYKTGSTVATYSDFGETKNGVWVPKEYKPSGSSNQYGTNGFRLTFSDSSNPANDSSGQGNHWTASGF